VERLPKAIIATIVIVGIVMIGLSIAFSFGTSMTGEAMGSVWITLLITGGGIILAFIAALWLFRKLAGGVNRDLLKMVAGAGGESIPAGLPGTASVLSVRDTGITINHINAMMEVGLRVQPDGGAPYETKTRISLARHSWGAIKPGMSVAVRIDPKDPQRVAIDLSAGVGVAAGVGAPAPAAGMVQTPGGAFHVPGMAGAAQATDTVSTADILRDGVRGEAEVRSVSNTGATAEQMAPGHALPADQADDPMLLIALRVHPRYDAPFDSQAIMRVPDGKLPLLSIGKRVPVAWPEGQPDSVTIDWPNLR